MFAYRKRRELRRIIKEIESLVNSAGTCNDLNMLNKEILLELKNQAIDLGCKGSKERALMDNISNLVTLAINRWQEAENARRQEVINAFSGLIKQSPLLIKEIKSPDDLMKNFKNHHSSSYSSSYSRRLNDKNKSDGAMLGGR